MSFELFSVAFFFLLAHVNISTKNFSLRRISLEVWKEHPLECEVHRWNN